MKETEKDRRREKERDRRRKCPPAPVQNPSRLAIKSNSNFIHYKLPRGGRKRWRFFEVEWEIRARWMKGDERLRESLSGNESGRENYVEKIEMEEERVKRKRRRMEEDEESSNLKLLCWSLGLSAPFSTSRPPDCY